MAEQVAPRHSSCTAVLSLNLICHIMSKHTCCSCPGVITCQRNVTVADLSPSISLTSSISFCPRSHLCLGSWKSPSFHLYSCLLLPFFFIYFFTSHPPIWTQIWGYLGKTQTGAKQISPTVEQVKLNTEQKQTYCQKTEETYGISDKTMWFWATISQSSISFLLAGAGQQKGSLMY